MTIDLRLHPRLDQPDSDQPDSNQPDFDQPELFPSTAPPRRRLPRPRSAPSGSSRLLGFSVLVLAIIVALVASQFIQTAATTTQPEPVSSAETATAPAVTAPAVTAPAVTTPVVRSVDVAQVAAQVGPSVVQLETGSGVGSGVIFDADGLILTAAHVIEDADAVQVRLADGRLLGGLVVGLNAATDIGVVAIDAADLPVAMLGYGAEARVGETAVALGSPFGFDQTVTAGIVSAVGRTVRGVPMVQTDAAINPGNSGGPLVNGAGQVIGINDVIFSEGGGSDGIGFAISIDMAIVVAEQLVAGNRVELAGLGAATIPDTSGVGGAIVREIVSGSPAEAAGLAVGDRIVTLDGDPVRDPGDLFAAIVSHRPGSRITLGIVRDGVTADIDATLVGIEL
jgi:S1-C subfamily serine protease